MSTFLPDPADLRWLVRSLDLGSFSAAAREHDVSVSVVTRAIDRLEAGYGARLLRRSTHGLSATPEGLELCARAREVLERLEDIGTTLAGGGGAVRGTVRLAVSTAMCEELLLPHLHELAREQPALRLEFVTDDRVVDLVTEGIDVALRTAIGNSESVVARELGAFDRRLYAAPAYLREHGTPQVPDDLLRHVLVTHTAQGSAAAWPLRVDGQVVDLPVRSGLAANTTSLVQRLLVAGHGIGLLSTPVAATAVARGELVEVLPDYANGLPFRLYAVSLPGRHHAARVRATVAFLERLARTRWAFMPPSAS
jgi:DNA-binding transcriptional LysR family regulator